MLIKQVFPESLDAASAYCKYFFRAEQATGDMENKAAGSALATKNTGFLDATLWAAAGYATVGGGAGNFCSLPAASHDLDHLNNTIVVTARILKVAAALPGAEDYIIGSYTPGSTTGGIILSCRTDGTARLYVNATDGTTANLSTAAAALTDGTTAVERSLVFIVPRQSASGSVAMDAIERNTAPFSTMAGKSIAGGNTLKIGGITNAYRVAAFAAHQIPVDSTAINAQQVYDWALRHPGSPMPDWVFA